MLVASPLDLQKNELRQAQIQNLASAPGSPVKGQMYFDTSTNKLYWWNGTAWIDATGGASATPDATASVKGVVQLAGDLAGTAAAPVVAPLAITDAKVAAANKDGANATPGMRSLGSAAGKAMPGSWSLDVIASATPVAGSISMSGQPITSVATPTNGTDAANKTYVDGAGANALSWKQAVRAASPSSNIALTGTYTLNGVALAAGDRVFAGNQSTGTQNGIYIVAAGAWTRAPDANTYAQFVGAVIPVGYGDSAYGGTVWMCQAFPGGVLDTNSFTFKQIPSAIASSYTSSSGQVLSGATTLDKIGNPVADVNLASRKITSLAEPTGSQDAATKSYVDTVAQGLDAKASVRVAYFFGNMSLTGAPVSDGVLTPSNGDRVLVASQATGANNGIYVVNTSGAWPRATDADTWNELVSAFVWVEQGAYQDTGWVCIVDQGGTLGTTQVTWTQFSGAAQITDGVGLLKTGNTLDVRLDGTTIEAPADILQVKASGITATHLAAGSVVLNSSDVTGSLPIANGGTGGTTAAEARGFLNAPGVYATTNTAGTTTTILYSTHQVKSSRNLVVLVRLISTGEEVIVDNTVNSNGDVVVTFATSQTGATYSIFITG